jgi:hypothetical protein
MSVRLFLPPHLEGLDLGPSLDTAAGSLRAAAPEWLNPRHPAADRALRYSRGRGGLGYEEIAERMQAALPVIPAIRVQTRATARRERDTDSAHRRNADIDELIDQITPLRHRALDLPGDVRGSLRFEGGDEHVTIFVESDTGLEEAWTFSLAHPPGMLMRDTVDAAATAIGAARSTLGFRGVFWLPFAAVLERGAFPRFQSARTELRHATEAGSVYYFVSHRWLATSEPDPEHAQARFFGWQLFAAVCEAIEIVADRGLRASRQASPLFNVPVGRFGGTLAENLVVGLLQPNLQDGQVQGAAGEVSASAADLEDHGSSSADRDLDLRQLRERLAAMPITRSLLDKVFVWYDYSCLPQAPRSTDDEPLFRDGLAHLNHVQFIGATAILLDEIDEYLGRAWCVLEAIAAEGVASLTGTQPFQLVGSRRSTNRSGNAEAYNQVLLRDAPHLVWRALLDTEVLACQTPEECLSRLDLAVTDPGDLPFIYEALRRMQVPDAPTDDFEVVTGYFPLPFAPDGASIYWRTRTERKVHDVPAPAATVDLDWTRALRLQELREAVGERTPLGVRPLVALVPGDDVMYGPEAFDGLHLAVVGSCETEAMLLARWVRERYRDIEQMLDRRAVSVSWLAADIVPVGCLAHAALQPVPVLSHRWIIISTEHRLAHCEVAGHLIETMRALGRPYGELTVDRAEQNFRWYEEREVQDPPDDLARRPIVDGLLRTHAGGLYRRALLPYLLAPGAKGRP